MNVKKKGETKPDEAKNAGSAVPPAAMDVAGVGNVDKIRDILFGGQMRDYERKFSNLDDRILKEVTRLREDATKRFDALENYINKELEYVRDGLKSEQSARKESVKELTDELKKIAKAFEKKATNLEDKLEKSTRDLRQQVLDQSKMLTEEIGSKYDETSENLEQTARELRDEKVDRSTLAELLTEMALRLSKGADLGLGLNSEDLGVE